MDDYDYFGQGSRNEIRLHASRYHRNFLTMELDKLVLFFIRVRAVLATTYTSVLYIAVGNCVKANIRVSEHYLCEKDIVFLWTPRICIHYD